jgi:hypothetical protein
MISDDKLIGARGIINYQTIPAILALFDSCYKRGVVNAFQIDDVNAAQRFVSDMRKPSLYATLCDTDIFGRLSEGRRYTFEKWRVLLAVWCRGQLRSKTINQYLETAVNERTCNGVIYPLCMDFYLQGIYHYSNNPLTDLTVFAHTKNAMLLPSKTGKRPFKIRTPDDWLHEIQVLCMERAEMEDERTDEDKVRVAKKSYDNFAQLAWYSINGRRGALHEKIMKKRAERKNQKLQGPSRKSL